MSHYIDPSYITDKLITDFVNIGGDNLEAYFDMMDAALVSLASRKGVSSTTDIDTDDDGYVSDTIIKDWCAAWIGKRLCWDNKGRNNPTIPEEDKYWISFKEYSKMLAELEEQITYETFTNTESERTDYVSTSYCFRG